jgi:hypothetical protein
MNTLQVFENRVLMRIFGPNKRDEERLMSRRLKYEEPHALNSSQHIIKMIKSRSMSGVDM